MPSNNGMAMRLSKFHFHPTRSIVVWSAIALNPSVARLSRTSFMLRNASQSETKTSATIGITTRGNSFTTRSKIVGPRNSHPEIMIPSRCNSAGNDSINSRVVARDVGREAVERRERHHNFRPRLVGPVRIAGLRPRAAEQQKREHGRKRCHGRDLRPKSVPIHVVVPECCGDNFVIPPPFYTEWAARTRESGLKFQVSGLRSQGLKS